MGIFSQTKQINLYEPLVDIKRGLKKIKVSGVSRMADPSEFYSQFSKDLISLYFDFKRTLFIEFSFDYINTGSSKWLFFTFQNLEKTLKTHGGIIEVTWLYDKDDEAIEESGEVFRSQICLPITLKLME